MATLEDLLAEKARRTAQDSGFSFKSLTQGRGAPADVTAQPTDIEEPVSLRPAQELTTKEAILPRFTKAPTTGRRVSGLFSDISSLPGRFAASEIEVPRFGEDLTPVQEEMGTDLRRESLSKTKGEGIGEQILRSPKTLPSLATLPLGFGSAFQGIKGGLKLGGIEGLLSTGAGQLERFSETGKVDPKEAAEEFSTNVLMSTLFPVFGVLGQKAGKKIFTSSAKQLTQEAAFKKGADVENLFKHKVAGGLEKSLEKVNNRISELGDTLIQQVKRKKGSVNLSNVRLNAEQNLLNKMEQGVNSELSEQVIKELDKWQDRIDLIAPGGEANWEQVLNWKRSVGKAGKFVHGGDNKQQAKEIVANELFDQFRSTLSEGIPETSIINQQLSELIPLKEPLSKATRQSDRNHAISLTDIILIAGGGGTGAFLGGTAGGVVGPAIGLTLNKLSKSPSFGAGLHNLLGSPIFRTGSKATQFPLRRGGAEQFGVTDEDLKKQAIDRAANGGN